MIKVGLIAVNVDEVVEQDFKVLSNATGDVTIFTTRFEMEPFDDEAQLEVNASRIGEASRILVPRSDLDVVAVACASGNAALGKERVIETVTIARTDHAAVVAPLEATAKACVVLSIKRLIVVSPYNAETNAILVRALEDREVTVSAVHSLPSEDYPSFGRIPPEAIEATIRTAAVQSEGDGFLVSCTGVQALGSIARMEEEIQKPVLTSNQCLYWDALRSAGHVVRPLGFGALLSDH
ncbi:MAG: hypothetical protein OXC62_03240 [Aestuariivita sp.]|nr:hypothetical protein [Aestuariivita sp.]